MTDPNDCDPTADARIRLMKTFLQSPNVIVSRTLSTELTPYEHVIRALIKHELIGFSSGVRDLLQDVKCPVLSKDENWNRLRQKIVEHNVFTVARHYSRIRLVRLAQLLEQDNAEQAEKAVCELVCAKRVRARIDRLTGVVDFHEKCDAIDAMNEHVKSWAYMMKEIELACHLINTEQMVFKVRRAATEDLKKEENA
ncbi:hypothetical protein ACOME3_003809 [Neoechinorhynchus agilis]